MKRFYVFIFSMASVYLIAQISPPESISYQGVARDASGNILSNQPIGIQFLIHQGSPSGTVVFSETHSTSTNAVGLFTLAIGSVNTSTFQSIPWNNGPYYLEVQMDPTGGTSYVPIGQPQQLLSVPYALYAKKAKLANNVINTGTSTAWNTEGNYQTDSTLNFIGTKDNFPLIFKTSNMERMRITSGGNVGIGTTGPSAKLDIAYTGTLSNGMQINYTSTAASGANSAIYTNANNTNGGNIFGGYFQLSGSSSSNVSAAVKAFNVANSSSNYGIQATATGTTTGTNYGGNFYASGAPNNYGVYSYVSGTGTTNIGGYFTASGATNNYAAIFDQGNVGIGMTIPSAKLHINSSLTTPALQIDNSSGHGIYIQNNGTSGSAIYAWLSNTSNNNSAIYSYVAGGGGSAVHAQTNGTGAAVRAIAGTTNASNLALHIDNGHIKSTMSAAPTVAIGMVGGGFYSTNVSLETGSNDVRGTVSMTTSVSSFASGNICEVQVNFAKPYNSVPYVVVCPAGSFGTDMQGLSFTVSAVTLSSFRIRIYKSDNMAIPASIPPNSTFTFNYFVIE